MRILKLLAIVTLLISAFMVAIADNSSTKQNNVSTKIETTYSIYNAQDSVYSTKGNGLKSNKTFVKTRNKCSKCSCSGYWGYKHGNGTYEGNCSNTDSHGHRCGHGPEKHGLRKW